MHSICNFLSWTADRTNLVGEIPVAMGTACRGADYPRAWNCFAFSSPGSYKKIAQGVLLHSHGPGSAVLLPHSIGEILIGY